MKKPYVGRRYGVPGRYPEKEYGHLLLGNGVDLVLIDWSGSMTFKDQINGIFAYWYKSERKARERDDPLPLLRVKYTLISSAGPVEISHSQQSFNPDKAILNTEIESSGFSFEIETFLTDEHLLVEHYKIREIPTDASILFTLEDPRRTYTGKLIPSLSKPILYYKEGEEIIAEYNEERYKKFSGIGRMILTVEKGTFRKIISDRGIFVKHLKPGNEFSRYLCVMDSMDCPNYKLVSKAIIKKCFKKDYPSIKREHQKLWRDYTAKSQVIVKEDKDINYQYQLSLYLLKAIQHPSGGTIDSPVFPNGHAGRVFWDSVFHQLASLKANRIEEAKKIALFWNNALNIARDNAKKLGSKGAYFGWDVDMNGFDNHFATVDQVHFNGDIALSCWMQYLYTRDTEYLKIVFPLMEETLDFLISSYVETKGDCAYVKPCESLDESSFKRRNDTWTLNLIIKGIDNLREASQILNCAFDSKYNSIQRKLKKGLEKNCFNGVLYSHIDRGDINVGSILSLILVEELRSLSKKTIQSFMNTAGESIGLGWGHSSRMRCKIFPWTEGILSILLSKMKDKRAFYHLKQMFKCINSFGGFGEYLWEHNLISRQWKGLSHATFVIALTEILVTENRGKIFLLPTIPKSWQNIRVKNLRLPSGLGIDFVLKSRKLKKITVRNYAFQPIEKRICWERKEKLIKLQAGKSVSFSI